MAVKGFKRDFDKGLGARGNPSMQTKREKLAKTKLHKQGLQKFMLDNNVCYDDESVIAGPGKAEKGQS